MLQSSGSRAPCASHRMLQRMERPESAHRARFAHIPLRSASPELHGNRQLVQYQTSQGTCAAEVFFSLCAILPGDSRRRFGRKANREHVFERRAISTPVTCPSVHGVRMPPSCPRSGSFASSRNSAAHAARPCRCLPSGAQETARPGGRRRRPHSRTARWRGRVGGVVGARRGSSGLN